MTSQARPTRSQSFRAIEEALGSGLETRAARLEVEARDSEVRARPLLPRAAVGAERVVQVLEEARRPGASLESASAREERRLGEVRARLLRERILPVRALVKEAEQHLARAHRAVQGSTADVARFVDDTDRDVLRLAAAEPPMAEAFAAIQAEAESLDSELSALLSVVRSVRGLAGSLRNSP